MKSLFLLLISVMLKVVSPPSRFLLHMYDISASYPRIAGSVVVMLFVMVDVPILVG